MAGRSCTCAACTALLNECGPELWPLYSKKLLLRGWAGTLSPAERVSVKAHRAQSEAQAAHVRELARHRFKKATENAA